MAIASTTQRHAERPAPASRGRARRTRPSRRARRHHRPSPPVAARARSTFEASAGQAVSATKVEIATAEAITQPNSTNSRPTCPGRNDSGTKTAISVTEVASTANVTWREPRKAGDERALAAVDPPLDVLEHDDGVVDDEADRQQQRQQRQHVDREAERADQQKAADQRHRDGDRRHQRRADAAQEQQDDADDQRQRDERAPSPPRGSRRRRTARRPS